MYFNFDDEKFFDNHTHLLFQEKFEVTPEEFALNYYHGVRDSIVSDCEKPSQIAVKHANYQSVLLTLVNMMSLRFDLEPTLDAVVAFRNRQTQTIDELSAYTKMLYMDQNVVGCVLDSAYPMGDPRTDCFPCKVFRLFQYENVFFDSLKSANSFDELMEDVIVSISNAAKEGFVGLKGHIGEKCGMSVQDVSDKEAAASLPAAANGDSKALSIVYYAMFSHLLEHCGKLDIPIHLHTGTTGFKKRVDVYTLDPILMAPYLKNPRFYKTKIVFLHGSFPFTRNASLMAYNFPNVYLDLSQTLPWQPILFSQILEDALSIVPHDKIMLGTGQHWYAEMVWVASKIAKRSLAGVMETLVQRGLLSNKQALTSAAMVLYQNALSLYGQA